MVTGPQVTAVGTPSMQRSASGSTGVTGSWGTGQNRTAGNLLVALVSAGGSTASAGAISTPSGWTQVTTTGNTTSPANAWAAVYYKVAAGSDAAPAFTSTLAGTQAMTCTLLELMAASDVVPVDTSGTYSSGGSSGTLTSMVVTTSSNVTTAADYAVTIYCQEAAAATNTWNPGSSWTNLAADGATSSVLHTAVDCQSAPTVLAAATETAHWTTNATAFGAAVIVAFAPQLGGLELYTNDAQTTITSGGTGAPAAGTPELWTAASWSSFPVASQTTAPPTTFHVADTATAASGELIEVLNTSTGLVVRGSQGTTPVSHLAGFTIQNVIPAGNQQPRVYNVRDPQFAATGNGSTDDTAAIQAALTACRTAGGGIVYVPEGVYLVSQSLQIGSDTTLIGGGTGAATIRCQVSSLSGFTQVGSNTGSPLLVNYGSTTASRIQVGPGITFDGNQANAGSLAGYADAPECAPVSLWNVSVATVTGIEVINAIGYSIYLKLCTDSNVTGCRVLSGAGSALGTNQQDGIHFTDCSEFRAENNDVDTGTGTAGDDALAVESYTGCFNGTIAGNVLRAAIKGVSLWCEGGTLSNITVTGNTVWASIGSAIGIAYGSGTVVAATNITIAGNTAANIGSASAAASGIYVATPFSGVSITGNSLSGFNYTAGGTGIYAVNAAGSGTCTDLAVTGNMITGMPGYYGILAGGTGTAQAVTNVTVTGNVADLSTSTAGNEPVGIGLTAITYGTVTGNMLYGNGDASSDGVYLLGATEYVTVTGNTARNFDYGAQEATSGSTPDYNTYGANNFIGCTVAYNLLGTHGTTAVSTPSFTSGTSKQLNTAQDVMLYIAVTTSVTASVAIGPTSTPAYTVIPSHALAVSLQTIRVPAGWYVTVTCGTMTDLTFTQIIC